MVSDAYALIKLGNDVFLYKEQRFYNLQFITVVQTDPSISALNKR